MIIKYGLTLFLVLGGALVSFSLFLFVRALVHFIKMHKAETVAAAKRRSEQEG